jgi:hypothetical protein
MRRGECRTLQRHYANGKKTGKARLQRTRKRDKSGQRAKPVPGAILDFQLPSSSTFPFLQLKKSAF